MDCRGKVVDEWMGFCLSCKDRKELVLLERGPRWTARELFGRTWTPRREFSVACRACGEALVISKQELTAAAAGKRPAPVRAAATAQPRTRSETRASAAARTPAPASAPARSAASSRPRPKVALPAQRAASDDARDPRNCPAASAGPRQRV